MRNYSTKKTEHEIGMPAEHVGVKKSHRGNSNYMMIGLPTGNCNYCGKECKHKFCSRPCTFNFKKAYADQLGLYQRQFIAWAMEFHGLSPADFGAYEPVAHRLKSEFNIEKPVRCLTHLELHAILKDRQRLNLA